MKRDPFTRMERLFIYRVALTALQSWSMVEEVARRLEMVPNDVGFLRSRLEQFFRVEGT